MAFESGLALAIAIFGSSMRATAAADEPPRPAIAILGTFHFANPGEDEFNIRADNVLSERRQRELDELLTILESFRPTKIAVERLFTEEEELNRRYRDYLEGELRLGPYEVHQIGFRLAKRLGRERLHAIDAQAPFDTELLAAFAAEHGQMNRLQAIADFGQALAGQVQQRLETMSLVEFFAWLNSEAFDSANEQLYLKHYLSIGDGAQQPGADLVADWHRRNLRIFANLSRIAEPGDRMLVIFGAGHKSLLRRFIMDREDLEYVEIDALLRSDAVSR